MSRCVLAIASAAMWACGAEGDAVAESGSSAGQDTGTDGRSVEDARIGDDAGIDAAADMGGDGETGGSPADDAGQPEGTTCTGAPGDGTETLLDLGYDRADCQRGPLPPAHAFFYGAGLLGKRGGAPGLAAPAVACRHGNHNHDRNNEPCEPSHPLPPLKITRHYSR
jgi:hypothetical protein